MIAARHAAWLTLVVLGCASEQHDDPDFDETETGGGLKGLGGSAGSTSSVPMAGKPANSSTGGRGGSGGSGGSGGTTSHAGKSSGGKSQGGTTGESEGGEPSEAGADSGTAGSGGSAGMPNQPNMCDEATATVLGGMQANIAVASNACLKIVLPADQTWIKKVTMQPEGGTYPLPFTWSNCGTNSSGAFTANYANQILNPVNLQCPVLVKLGGPGTTINIQWWGA